MTSLGIRMTLMALAVSAGPALAQSGAPAPPTDAQEKKPAQVQTPAQPPSQAPPQAGQPQGVAPSTPNVAADAASAAAQARLAAVRERSRNLPAKEKEDAAKQTETIAREVDQEAVAKGDAVVAGRIASEFGMTAEALQSERQRFNSGLGELMIAHTLLAGAKSDLTVDQLYQMRNEGMGWGEIAHGMGLHVGHAMTAIRLEGRVARGFLKPDGKAAKIATSEKAPGAAAAGAKKGAGAAPDVKREAPKGKGGY